MILLSLRDLVLTTICSPFHGLMFPLRRMFPYRNSNHYLLDHFQLFEVQIIEFKVTYPGEKE